MNRDITKEKFNAILFLMGKRAVQEGRIEEFESFCKNLTQKGKENENIHTVR